MAAKHTPGPWKFTQTASEYYTLPSTVETEDEECIATVHPMFGDGLSVISGSQDANARLIAQAPAMYEVIRDRLAVDGHSGALACPCDICNRSRAILAAVEGE